MKKIFAIVLSLLMLATAAAIPAAAVDNYTPKTINLIVNADGTCSLPEGYVVYIGDTIVVPRKELTYVGDFVNSKTGETEKDAVVIANSYNFMRGTVRIGSAWVDTFVVSDEMAGPKNGWKQDGATMAKAGTYTLHLTQARDAGWTAYYTVDIDLITFEVVDPKEVDEIVIPSTGTTTTSSEAESSVAETSSAAASSEVTSSSEAVSSEAASSAATSSQATSSAVTSSKADSSVATTDNEPKNNQLWLWIVIAAVVVVAVVVVVIVSKKKK